MGDKNSTPPDLSKWVPLFRSGSYKQGEFGPEVCSRIVKDYDPNIEEAFLSFDHAESGPASGWIHDLKFESDLIWARFKEIDSEARKAVEGKRYKRRSVEIVPRHSATNGPYLQGVTLLGVKAPAVKGLPPVEFSGNNEDEVLRFQVDIKDLYQQQTKQEHPTKEETMAGKRKDPVQDPEGTKVSPETQEASGSVDAETATASNGSKSAPAVQSFAATGTGSQDEVIAKFTERLDAANKENQDLKAQVAKMAAKFAAQEEDRRRESIDKKLSALTDQGKVTPAELPYWKHIAYSIDQEQVLKFSAVPKADPIETNCLDALFTVLGKRKPAVHFSDALPQPEGGVQVPGSQFQVAQEAEKLFRQKDLAGEVPKGRAAEVRDACFSEVMAKFGLEDGDLA